MTTRFPPRRRSHACDRPRHRRPAFSQRQPQRFRRLLVESLEDRRMLAEMSAHWIGGTGNWSDPANWDIGVVPNNSGSDTYAVVVDLPGSDPVITVDQAVTVTALTNSETLRFATGSSAITSQFDNSGTIQVTAASAALTLSGTVTNSGNATAVGGTLQFLAATVANAGRTITADGGVVEIADSTITGGLLLATDDPASYMRLTASGGRLDGVTVIGDLDLATYPSATVHIVNGLTLNGTAWLGNAAGSSYGRLYFDGTQTLDGAGTVVFGKHSSNFLGTDNTTPNDPSADTLTIGAGLTLRGSAGTIGDGFGAATIINHGSVAADDSGGLSRFAYDTGFESGDPAGTAAAIDSSGVSDSAPQAVYQTARYGGYYYGPFPLLYTLANLEDGLTYTLRLHFAEIQNPAVGQRKFHVDANGTRLLTDLDIVAAAGGVNKAIVRAFEVTADAAGTIVLNFQPTNGYSGTSPPQVNGIELLSGTTVVRAINAGLVSGGALTVTPNTFVNQGTVQATAGMLSLGGTWDNRGTLETTGNGTLNLGGAFTTAALGTMNYLGGTINLTGTLDNSGATLTLDASTGSWNVRGGMVKGGTYSAVDGAALRFTNSSGTLDGVTWNGDLDLATNPGATVHGVNGLTLNGTAWLGNAAGSTSGGLYFRGTQTLDGTGTVVFGTDSGNCLRTYNTTPNDPTAETLTIGASLTVRGSAGTIGDSLYAATIVNHGTIVADASGGSNFSYDASAGYGFDSRVTANTQSTIDTSGVEHPAPQVVYQSARTALGHTWPAGSQPFSYTLANLTAGSSYTVRLHFAVLGDLATLPFDVLLNGTPKLTNFNIAAAAGGVKRAVVREFSGTADSDGKLTLMFTDPPGSIGNPQVNGIELFSGTTVLRAIDAGLVSSGTITINPSSFLNQGQILASSAGTVTLDGAWSNRGTLAVLAAETPPPADTFSTAGLDLAWPTSATVNLGGTFTTVGLGTLHHTGGTVNLLGELDNTGATLGFDASTGSWNLRGGTVRGGTYTAAGNAALRFTNAGGTLDGVTANSDLDLATNSGAYGHVRNGLTLNSTAWLGNAAGSTYGGLYFDGTQTLDGTGTVVFGKHSGNFLRTYNTMPNDPTADTLTIGAGLTVRGSAGMIGDGYNEATIINHGTIAADIGDSLNGFTFDYGFSGGSTDSTGAANIDTSGVSNPAPQAVYQTLRYAAGELSYTLMGLTPGNNYLVRLHFSEPGVQVQPGQRQFDVEANGVRMVSALDVVAAAGGHNKAVVREFTAAANEAGQLTLRLVHTVTADPYVIINGIELLSGATVIRAIDAGLISSATLTVAPNSLVNQGALRATTGTLNLGGSWHNRGTIAGSAGATLNLGGSFTTGDIGTWNPTGATINLTGSLDNADATLALDTDSGSWNLVGGTINGGTVTTVDGATLVASSAGGMLVGVTFGGDILLTKPYSRVTVTQGLTLNGTLTLGDNAYATFDGSQTLGGHGTVVFASNSNSGMIPTDGSTLTIGPGINVRGGSGFVGNTNAATVLRGTVSADTPGRTIYLSGEWRNEGTLHATNGGIIDANGTLRIDGLGRLAEQPSGQIIVRSDLLGDTRNADRFAPLGIVRFQGPSSLALPQSLEVMGRDLGQATEGFHGNFTYGTLALAANTYVLLVDFADNAVGSGAEALYVNSLVIGSGATLDLNGLHLYARTSQIDGAVVGGTVDQLPDGGTLAFATPTPGAIGAPGELDEWSIFGRANRTIGILVNPGNGGTPAPANPPLSFVEVTILDAANHVLATSNNSAAGGLVSLDNVQLPADGIYRVQVRAASGHSANTGNYLITAYDITPDVAALDLNQIVTGAIENPFSVDRWTFSAAAGQSLHFELINVSTSGLVFDLTGPFGVPVFTGLHADSDLITLSTSGNYTLSVHGTAGQTGSYAFRLAANTPTDLTLGEAYVGTLVGSGQAQLFRVQVPASTILTVTLDDLSIADRNELYLKFGAPPTRADYAARSSAVGADQEVMIPQATAGTWYILAYSEFGPAPSTFTLTASASDLTVTSATLERLGTNGDGRLTLTGAGFNSSTYVALRALDGTVYPVDSVQVDSFTRLTATASLLSVAPPSYYGLSLICGTPFVNRLYPLTVTSVITGATNFEPRLILPGAVRRNSVATIYVEYTNTGAEAMAAPVLILQSGDPDGSDKPWFAFDSTRIPQNFWTSAVPDGFSHTLQILASGRIPGLLQAGESARVPVYFAGLQQPWDTSDLAIEVELRTLTASDATAIDWNALETPLRPPSIGLLGWHAIFANVIAQIGSTWGDYVRMLDDNAAYLGRLGEQVLDVGQLWAFEVEQANGLSPIGPIASVVDIAVPTPGLTLSFGRVFSDSLASRNDTGLLGIGWSTPWETELRKDADGSVTVIGASGGQRRFQPDSRNAGYFPLSGDHGTLISTGGGTFALRELDGITTAFRADGRLDYVADTNGNRITAGYSGDALVTLTHSAGPSLTFSYLRGLIETITASDGRVVRFTYGPPELSLIDVIFIGDQHLIAVQGYDGQTTQYTYGDGFQTRIGRGLTSIQFPDGTHQFLAYDDHARLASVARDGNAERVTFTYDTAGKVTITDAAGNASKLFFDHRGLLVKVEDPLGHITQSTFDNNFNLTRITDTTGAAQTYKYDDRGNVIAVTDALGHTTQFTYGGPFNQLTSVATGRGSTTRYAYDARGNLLSTTYPNNTVERLTYDALGNPLSFTNRRGQAIGYVYNPAGQITRQNFADGSHNDFAYDARGNLISATDTTGVTTFDYDSGDRLTRVAYPTGRFLEYAYNAAGRRTQMVTHDSPTATPFIVNYAYDAVGRLAGLTDGSDGQIVTYTYDAVGRLSRKDQGNQTFTTFEYDEASQLLHLVNHAPDGSVNSRFDYTYDSLGRRTRMATLDGTWTYSYDATGQLTHAVFASTNAQIPSQDLTYVYDPLGNRIRTIENGVTTNYTTNNLNQYVLVGNTTYAYDADGNVISSTDSSGATTYSYDSQNRLVRAVSPTGTWDCKYDALGNRIATTQNGNRTEFLLDPTGAINTVGEYDGMGVIFARYTFGLGLVSRMDATASAAFYDFDATGSTVGLSNLVGAYQNQYQYLPFGGLEVAVESVSNPFQFVGQFGAMNDGDGLIFMRARQYNVTMGRFSSEDPLGLAGGDANLYRYVHNSPLGFIDPTGLISTIPVNVLNEFEKLKKEADEANKYDKENYPHMTPPSLNDIPRYSPEEFVKRNARAEDLTKQKNEMPNGPVLPKPYDSPNNPFRGPLPDIQFPRSGGDVIPGTIPIVVSDDPNEKTGPAGFGPTGFTRPDGIFSYRIDFENESTATAPAQQVVVTDQLDAALDWETFELTEIGFGDHVISIPPNMQRFQTTVDVTYSGVSFQVQIEAGLHSETGEVFARFQSIDPNTSLPPEALIGFLPPEDGTGRGKGYFSYIIEPKPNLITGTEIRNVALIRFDGQEIVATDQVDPHDPSQGTDPAKQALNTIDAGLPTSQAGGLPPRTASTSFTVSWSGSDDVGGSGIAGYDVYYREDDDDGLVDDQYQLWLPNTTATSAVFALGRAEHSYSFYTVAMDNVGHREATPIAADAQTQVVTPLFRLGVAGDSLSDEYAEASYSYANNWVELLSQDVSVGPQGSWGAPRDEGFEYNWAQAGATSDTLLADGQHAGLAQQITAGSIDYGVLAIGQNDFGPWTEAYVEIYNGTWDAAQIDAYVGQVVGNIQTALQTLTATGGKIVLSNVIDYGIAPRTRSLWPDPDKRELVTDVIRRVNGALLGLAQEYAVPLINGFAATKNFLGDNQTTVATIPVGGVDLVNANGVEPQCMFVDDGIHPHTVGQAVIANLVVEAIRLGYGQDVAALPFTEREMLELVGLGNQYTGDTLNLNYTQYIILPGNPPGISVSPISRPTAEPNGTATFTIVLNTQPVADVTIHLNSSNPNEGTVSPTSVTFTVANWNVPQVVTVTGVDDDKDDGTVAYSVVTAPAVSYRRSLPGTGCRRRGGVESR